MSLTILATTDVHGYFPLEPHTGTGVFALNTLKETFDQPILIDNGDFLIGSPFATYLNEKFEHPLMDFANELGYDVMVPGNHDFDYGLPFLLKQVDAFKGDYVCANALTLTDDLLFKPYTIIERHGKKVGIIGLVTGAMPQLTAFENIRDLKFRNVIETLNEWLPIVRKQADLVIVSYHGGIEKDKVTHADTQYDTGEDQAHRILASFPHQIDGLICGHQHRRNQGHTYGAAFVQPGFRGQVIGELTFTFDGSTPTASQTNLIDSETFPANHWTLTNPADYHTWLNQSFNQAPFEAYLNHYFAEKHYLVEFKGTTIQALQETFAGIYPFLRYHLTGQELRDSLAKSTSEHSISQLPQPIDPEADYQVLTNSPAFPAYRVERQYIDNVFDGYLRFLGKND